MSVARPPPRSSGRDVLSDRISSVCECAPAPRFGKCVGLGWGGSIGSVASFVCSFATQRSRVFSPPPVFTTFTSIATIYLIWLDSPGLSFRPSDTFTMPTASHSRRWHPRPVRSPATKRSRRLSATPSSPQKTRTSSPIPVLTTGPLRARWARSSSADLMGRLARMGKRTSRSTPQSSRRADRLSPNSSFADTF